MSRAAACCWRVEMTSARVPGTLQRGASCGPGALTHLVNASRLLVGMLPRTVTDAALFCCREAPKKISAVAFSGDGRAALFADKFGDVLVAAAPDPDPASTSIPPAGFAPGDQGGAAPSAATATRPQAQNGTAAPPLATASEQDILPQARKGTLACPSAAASEQGVAQAAAAAAAPAPGGVGAMATAGTTKPALLLGHFCSTITAVAVAPAGRLLASADRDGKVRVSILPRRPLLVRLHNVPPNTS